MRQRDTHASWGSTIEASAHHINHSIRKSGEQEHLFVTLIVRLSRTSSACNLLPVPVHTPSSQIQYLYQLQELASFMKLVQQATGA
jgi:hypothetical protein